MHTYNFWVFKDKLLGTLVLLAEEAGASFDKTDYNAILYGLMQTNSEDNNYFAYIFSSLEAVTIQFARDPENDAIIHLQVPCNSHLFLEAVERIDRFQCHFTTWTLIDETHFH